MIHSEQGVNITLIRFWGGGEDLMNVTNVIGM